MENKGNTNLIVILIIFVVGGLFYLYYPEQLEYQNPNSKTEKEGSNTNKMIDFVPDKENTGTSTDKISTSTEPI